ncbi:MAG: hypothetical protein EWV83_20910 [Microcystis sp. M_OC_Ca_00000000_S217Cul]|uniref:Uncharacterized protein n=1 Tax=Microcystis aeruginosa BLCC-F108 TaxID=2755317 RepID=A0A841UMJ3_MICAE|nr:MULTISPECIES: hypothetical protein [Microcystis]MBC1192253.1 hypothetical protein [Microcystis aeruginosa BLCC-F108]MCA2589570.1 hypothetical protein [Microcystis sp. M31BS1]MDB9407823.1 hypothetical protein [Microcystis aeruginosa CS-558/01A06]TRT71744.1 MAG: hypothetical protein EWV83_20910 [Microcystis sp. M_OC_Ca_00000000_S217Cul]TRT91003.1 MAG: hypothetical protein EWV66_07200 [Microcystis sp. M_OC_Ca_00000000_C217Col]
MLLTLNLTSEIEQYLSQKAREKGLSLEDYVLKLLKDTILEQEKQAKLVNLLQSWIDEEDEQEQQETGEYLIEALDQDRLSERPLFPAELKGVTW